MVAWPTPHSTSTPSPCSQSTARLGGITSSPSGLPWEEPSLARNLLAATPTVTARPVSSRTLARRSAAMAGADPARRLAPPTSRNASSRLSGSTSGVTARKTAMTARETSW